MNIDVSQIVAAKLAQLDEDGTIKRKIEESLEKTIMTAITSELESYRFQHCIQEQLKAAVSTIAADCGLSAYNGYIAEKCKAIVQNHFTTDISERVEKTLNDIMFTRYENIKLSDIFKRYREWVLANTEEDEKHERGTFTHALEVENDGAWTSYRCKFADHTLAAKPFYSENPDVEINFMVFQDRKEASISTVFLNGHFMKDSFKVGRLTDFEAFILNLYYNETKIIMDEEDVEEEPYFDIDI